MAEFTGTETDEAAGGQVLLKFPPSLHRAVKKAARESGLFIGEYVRAVLRGEQKPPEIGDEGTNG